MRGLPLLVRVLTEPAQARGLADADWELLLRQAHSADLICSLDAVLADAGLDASVPPQARTQFAWWRTIAERHAATVRWEVACIRAALAVHATPIILLKGAAYVMAGLPAARGRLFNDIDILVPRAALNQVEADLMMEGWASTHLDAYDQRYYRDWMHELPPMQHRRRETSIDVHHAILPPTAAAHPDSDKLRAAATALPGLDGVSIFAPADLVLHSAVHLFHDGEFGHGLRDLLDIDRLLAHFGASPGFWPALAARASELDVARALFYALRYSHALLGTPVPPALQAGGTLAAGGQPPRALLALMDALFQRALLPDHASCDSSFTPLARFLLYIRANWLRMPPLLLARHLLHKAFLSPKSK